MPTFKYEAMTKTGLIVKNRMEETNKENCIKTLKRNGLTPISVKQTLTITNEKKAKGKNKNVSEEVLQKIKNQKGDTVRKKRSFMDQLDTALLSGDKITPRDIIIFTENFLLLKKASFNNVHALSTIIESTENIKFKRILEDILAGVERWRIHVYNNGIL